MNETKKPDSYIISSSHMYFIYSFMCDKAIIIARLDREYCEEFREKFKLYKRTEGYEFAYEKRISRQLVLNMPYRHIEFKEMEVEIDINYVNRVIKFLKVEDTKKLQELYPVVIKENNGCFLKFTDCIFKIYEDGRGIFRFKAEMKKGISIKEIVRFMDISSLPAVWRKVKKEIECQIGKQDGKPQGNTKWVEVNMNVVPPEGNDNNQELIWQTPQIFLHLKMDDGNYEKFSGKSDQESSCDNRLQWIHYILNKSKGETDTIDKTFARYFTSILKDSGKFDVLNMCYNNEWYYTLSPDVLLFVSKVLENNGDKKERYDSTTEWVEVRLLEVYEFLRLRWYSLIIADELLDNAIQELGRIREVIGNNSDDINILLKNIKDFLNDWINDKCIILRSFEDPSNQRSAGLTFDLVYKKGEEYFLIKEMEEMVRFKLEHIDKVYTDLMDLARINTQLKIEKINN